MISDEFVQQHVEVIQDLIRDILDINNPESLMSSLHTNEVYVNMNEFESKALNISSDLSLDFHSISISSSVLSGEFKDYYLEQLSLNTCEVYRYIESQLFSNIVLDIPISYISAQILGYIHSKNLLWDSKMEECYSEYCKDTKADPAIKAKLKYTFQSLIPLHLISSIFYGRFGCEAEYNRSLNTIEDRMWNIQVEVNQAFEVLGGDDFGILRSLFNVKPSVKLFKRILFFLQNVKDKELLWDALIPYTKDIMFRTWPPHTMMMDGLTKYDRNICGSLVRVWKITNRAMFNYLVHGHLPGNPEYIVMGNRLTIFNYGKSRSDVIEDLHELKTNLGSLGKLKGLYCNCEDQAVALAEILKDSSTFKSLYLKTLHSDYSDAECQIVLNSLDTYIPGKYVLSSTISNHIDLTLT